MDEFIGRLVAKVGVNRTAAANGAGVAAHSRYQKQSHELPRERRENVARGADSNSADVFGQTDECAYEQPGRSAVGFIDAIPSFGQFV